MKNKALKIIIVTLLAIILCITLVFLIRQIRTVRLDTQASRFISRGEFEKAREIYLKLDDSEMVRRCDELIEHRTYLKAKELIDSRDYVSAKELLITVQGHLDAAELITKCDYCIACSLQNEGDFLAALSLFEALGGYSDSTEKIAWLKEKLYTQAVELAYGGDFYRAKTVFDTLDDYLDCKTMSERCLARITMADGSGKSIIDAENVFASFDMGKLYIADVGYVFIPGRCDESTQFLIFFPGGKDIEEPRDYIFNCLETSSENTIILFLYKNGLNDMQGKAEAALNTLRKAAGECAVTLKAPLLCGTSMGAYPAMHAAAYYHENYALTVPKVLCFDAGADWDDTELTLSAYECALLAKTDTEFWLFEQQGVGMNRDGINLMAASGCRVTMMVCANQDHNAILYDALNCGMINWAFGRRGQIESNNYTYITLDPYSTYPE